MCDYKISLSWEEIRSAYPNEPVERLQRLGVTPQDRGLDCDGKIGPLTRGATYINPTVFFVAKELFTDLRQKNAQVTPNELALAFKRQHGIYLHPIALAAFEDAWAMKGETLGNNRGPYVSELYEDDNPEAQQGPWCGVAGRKWIRAAYPNVLPNPRQAWLAKGLAGRMRKVSAPRLIQSGDQLTLDRFVKGTYENTNGHAATCVLVDGDVVWTIEGNVDVTRARDGKPSLDGVAVRRYHISKGLVSSAGAPMHQVSRWPE